jgi:hypothetical protein
MYWTGPTCEDPDTTQCRTTNKGTEYEGTISVTSTGTPCLAWSLFTEKRDYVTAANFPDESVAAASNYCRNPDSDTNGIEPWCFTTTDTAWEWCDIPTCPGYY